MEVQLELEDKTKELELLNEILHDITELNLVLESEMSEINKKNKVSITASTNIIDLYYHFETPDNILLDEVANKSGIQYSLDNVKHQKELLSRYLEQ